MNYEQYLKKIEIYKNKFNVKQIGSSVFGRKIFAVEKINRPDFFTAIFLCSVHAREHIATDLVCKMIDDGLFDGIKNFNLSFILMGNPDGVNLCCNGLMSAPENKRLELLNMNKGSVDFSLWKANGRGVDINNNFDAEFGTNIGSQVAGSSGFAGEFAESEPETKAIADYARSCNVFFTISYHTKGEEIYFNFFQEGDRLNADSLIAERFAKSSGYAIKNPEASSSGGFKDYCVETLKIPALTIELGSDDLTHPIGQTHLNEIYLKHKNVASDVDFAYNVFVTNKEIYGIRRKVYEESFNASKES